MQIVRHKSGLELRIAEMPGFCTSCAQIGVKYGSVHTAFRRNGTMHSAPQGTAHFLEHQLFENADGNVDYKFAAIGAASNAYTEFDATVYLFRTAQRFPEALSLLLDFVQKPYFTAENVRKERSIILQELAEALDDPENALFTLLLNGLYHRHPVKYDVLGTAESIAQITPDILMQAWQSFYCPQNMVLCCAGPMRAEDVIAAADRLPLRDCASDAEPLLPEEPETVVRTVCSKKMAVGKTQFAIGFKSTPVTGAALERELLLGSLVLELIAGSASPLVQRLLSEGCINDSFTTDCFAGEERFLLYAEGESDDPQAVLEALLTAIETAKREGLDARRFETLRRCAIGDLLMSRNDPPAMAEAMLQAWLCGLETTDLRMQLLRQLTLDDAQDFLAARLRHDRVCLAVIYPE